jgi:hypothetical protein
MKKMAAPLALLWLTSFGAVAQQTISSLPSTNTVAGADDLLLNKRIGANYSSRRIAWSNAMANVAQTFGTTAATATNRVPFMEVSTGGSGSTGPRHVLKDNWGHILEEFRYDGLKTGFASNNVRYIRVDTWGDAISLQLPHPEDAILPPFSAEYFGPRVTIHYGDTIGYRFWPYALQYFNEHMGVYLASFRTNDGAVLIGTNSNPTVLNGNTVTVPGDIALNGDIDIGSIADALYDDGGVLTTAHQWSFGALTHHTAIRANAFTNITTLDSAGLIRAYGGIAARTLFETNFFTGTTNVFIDVDRINSNGVSVVRFTATNNFGIHFTNITASCDGKEFRVESKQDGTGSRLGAMAGPSNWRFGEEITGTTFTTTANRIDHLKVIIRGTNAVILGFLRGYQD